MYVNYTVANPPNERKEFQAGPYANLQEAERHMADIAGYEFVSQCHVSPHRDLNRVLINSIEARYV